jgi:TrmH family RNA methyltransferase
VALIGTSPDATAGYREVELQAPSVLLMGCESTGLSVEKQEPCDEVVRIPMVGRSDSLNVAVATGVVLYELYHRAQSASHTA